ncbi:thiamine ABC transporter substrate-binding protein [Halococcus saccharolyticus]|uniref:ABC transporter periplasmic protein n=1 Tax=Halococcus saccharolyticus DSM 5350 TaxID=1227455 RepID=M0MFC9_9EURY|nr:thiamine ABC transporter substrate-binding protein [Halococcus saccharolyticus]EMA43399.1 ABC transporter periplasmic protein [Halococcus saccharolyticus DSM 5350]
MQRRRFIRRAGAGVAGLTLLAGCTGSNDGGGSGQNASNSSATNGSTESNGTSSGNGTAGGDGTAGGNGTSATNETGATTGSASASGTLTVATYSSFTGEDTAGNWLKSAFEAEHSGTTVEFVTPENGVNQYIQRAKQGAPIDADVYVGLNASDLVRVSQQLDTSLFQTAADSLDRADTVKDELNVDPNGRAIPYDTGYISLVYNEDEVEEPQTFASLLESRYEGDLITQNAQQSDPGRAFLLWSIITQGEDGYLDYWEQLLGNGVSVLSDWEPAYQAYMDGEAPMVVSYSTDQVFYHGPDVNMAKHQIGFLNDQGYANPETMALFADSENAELGRRFMEFVLTENAQSNIAVKNVQFPAVKGVTPSDEFAKYAKEPPEPVTFSYDELAGSVGTWVEEWARLVAGA